MRINVNLESKLSEKVEIDEEEFTNNFFYLVYDNEENELENEIVSVEFEHEKNKIYISTNLAVEIPDDILEVEEFINKCKFILSDEDENEYKAKLINIIDDEENDDFDEDKEYIDLQEENEEW